MANKELMSQISDSYTYKTDLTKNYTTFLSKYPEIFSDLISGSIFDFAIYDSLKSYDNGSPIDIFNVLCNGNGIEIKPGKAEDADLELALSLDAVEKLIKTNDKEEYAQLFGSFYNEPDEENGWIDFMLHKKTQILLDRGYGKFAQTAGILEDYM